MRGIAAYEVRWTDSDDVAKIVVERPFDLPVAGGSSDWNQISVQPFRTEQWGKREKAM